VEKPGKEEEKEGRGRRRAVRLVGAGAMVNLGGPLLVMHADHTY
jgi:hypothetical protein